MNPSHKKFAPGDRGEVGEYFIKISHILMAASGAANAKFDFYSTKGKKILKHIYAIEDACHAIRKIEFDHDMTGK
jgi:hypothetical protein